MPRRKTFSGGEVEIQEFLETATEQVRAHVVGIQATQKQLAWAIRIGMPLVLGMTDQAFGERFREMAGGTVRLSIDERREAAAQLTTPLDEGGEGLTQREAAAVLGVTQPTVSNDLRLDKDLSDSNDEDDKDLSDSGTRRCARHDTPTLPMVDAANGPVDSLPTGPTVLETIITGEPETKPVINGWEAWQAFIDLSAWREVDVADLVEALPTDRLEYALPVIEALGEWLPQITEGVRRRVEQLPVALATTRDKRDRREGRLWHAPA